MIPAAVERERARADCDFDALTPSDMQYPEVPRYSKKDVVRAGKVLRQTLRDGEYDDYGLSLDEAFRIAHNWRDAHSYPMWRVRLELAAKSRRIDPGYVAASRLKRMDAIRRKLRRPFTLYQLQDIAGCRVILREIEHVNELAGRYLNGYCIHHVNSEDDYLSSPKPDGYRGQHIILKFNGVHERAVFNRQTIELQIRTRLQHAWATAVEAVGLVKGQDIKGGGGDQDWRTFFQLMSSEIADREDCNPVPGFELSASERHKQIKDLSRKLKAVKTLESLGKAVRYDEIAYYGEHSRYFLLQYDYETQNVTVRPYDTFPQGSNDYVLEERKNAQRNTVLVEIDQVTDLRKAYPNYFLDVKMFTDCLREVLSPTHRAKRDYDLSWLKDWK